MKRKKMDPIEQLIEVSDRCMTFIPKFTKGGKEIEQPCNCRKNVIRILRRMGVRIKKSWLAGSVKEKP